MTARACATRSDAGQVAAQHEVEPHALVAPVGSQHAGRGTRHPSPATAYDRVMSDRDKGPAGLFDRPRQYLSRLRLARKGLQVQQSARAEQRDPARIVAKLRMEKKGRGGKTVTVVYGLPNNAAFLKELCSELKRACGTGGAVDDGRWSCRATCAIASATASRRKASSSKADLQ